MKLKDDEVRAAELLQECLARLAEKPLSDVTDRFERTPRVQRDALQTALEGSQALEQGLPDALLSTELLERVLGSLRRRAWLRDHLPDLQEALRPFSPQEGFAPASGEDLLAALRQACQEREPSGEVAPPAGPKESGTHRTTSLGGRRSTSATLAALPRESAERVVERYWGASVPVDPVTIAEQLGILVVEVPISDLEACLVVGPEYAVIAVSSLLEDPGRRRFAVAHEVGHYVLHRNQASVFRDEAIDLAGREEWDRDASAFAAALLVPEAQLRRRGPVGWPSMEQANAIAREFQTSLTGAALRLVDRADEASMLVAFWQGKVEWAVRSEFFPVTIRPGRPAPETSATAAVMEGEPPPPDYAEIHASEWFPKVIKVETGHLQEHPREVYPGLVLTILNMV